MNERDGDNNNQLLQKLQKLVNDYRDHLAKIIKKKVGIDLRHIKSSFIDEIELKHATSYGRVELYSTFLIAENKEVKKEATMINLDYPKSIKQAIQKFKAINTLYKILNAEDKDIEMKLDKFNTEFSLIKELLTKHRSATSHWYASTLHSKHITRGQKFIEAVEKACANNKKEPEKKISLD